jgi:hypothetical protein
MAPIDQKLSTSPLPKQKTTSSPIPDDDEKWLDLTDAPTETEDYPKIPMQSMNAYNGIGPFDPLNRVAPTVQHTLEAQLLHLGEVDLGLYNAIAILESHFVDQPESPELERILSRPAGVSGSTLFPRNQIYQSDRSLATQILKDIGYLMGLKNAVKILQAALADPDRKDIMKYKFKFAAVPPMGAMSPPLMPGLSCGVASVYPPGFPVQVPLPGAQYMPPMSTQGMQEQLRVIAKDIVKDTVKECKNEGGSTESVQQEMIKLLRDVCRDALHKKE